MNTRELPGQVLADAEARVCFTGGYPAIDPSSFRAAVAQAAREGEHP